MSIKKLQKNSIVRGELPKGCKYCAKGQKLVLLVTGLCDFRCFYCPLSTKKRGKNVVYANEKLVKNNEDIIYEAKSINALGTGITGGDPLRNLDKTLVYISMLKDNFGTKHHIHLYTGTAADAKTIRKLSESGLDEIRFHLLPKFWDRISVSKYNSTLINALKTNMDVGVEVPVIPDCKEQLICLIDYLDRMNIDFINLNELEFSDTNWRILKKRGYEIKNDVSSGVKGSEELGIELVTSLDTDIAIHYCSTNFKDAIQLKNRIKRRARYIAKKYDVITDEGTLMKGIIEGKNLNRIRKQLLKDFKIPKQLISVDSEKNRIELASWVLEKIADRIPYCCFIIEEYPTADRLEVERVPLKKVRG